MKLLKFNTISAAWTSSFPVMVILLGAGLAATALADEAAPAPQDVTAARPAPEARAEASHPLETQWGIQVTAIRLSANGNIIDFRYRVTDAGKAAVLADVSNKPVLTDQKTGAQLRVPSMPKVGQLRGTASRFVEGRVYTALFANPGRLVKAGSQVTITAGAFRAENLQVTE